MSISSLAIRDPRRVREGLPIEPFDEIKRVLDLTDQQAAVAAGLSPRTLGRRRREGRFAPEESDRIVRLLRLVSLALQAFEHDEEAVHTWFKTPHVLLRGETPLCHADTEPGARAVEDVLSSIRYGFAT